MENLLITLLNELTQLFNIAFQQVTGTGRYQA